MNFTTTPLVREGGSCFSSHSLTAGTPTAFGSGGVDGHAVGWRRGLEAAVFGGDATRPQTSPKLQTESRVCRFDPCSVLTSRYQARPASASCQCTEGLMLGMKGGACNAVADPGTGAIGVLAMLRSGRDRTGFETGRRQRNSVPAANRAQSRRPIQERISGGAKISTRGSSYFPRDLARYRVRCTLGAVTQHLPRLFSISRDTFRHARRIDRCCVNIHGGSHETLRRDQLVIEPRRQFFFQNQRNLSRGRGFSVPPHEGFSGIQSDQVRKLSHFAGSRTAIRFATPAGAYVAQNSPRQLADRFQISLLSRVQTYDRESSTCGTMCSEFETRRFA